MTEAIALKPDFRIFKQETTEHWSEDIRNRAGKLFAVYMFDANRHHYCCEITPSFEMRYLGPTWTSTPDAPDDDDSRQDLFEDIIEGDGETPEAMYVHVRNVKLDDCEVIGMDDAAWLRFLRDEDGDPDKAWTEALDKWMEYCRGNGWVY